MDATPAAPKKALARQQELWRTLRSAGSLHAATLVVVFGLGVYAILSRYGTAPTLYNQYDDAYITYRYAMNFAMGRGLVFNVGEPTDAASSFLYTMLLAIPYRLGFHDLEKVATFIGVVSSALVGVIVFHTTFRVTGRRLVAAACAFVSVYHGFISGWAISGMETCFYAALIAGFVSRVFILRRNDAMAAVLLAAILLTRVEGAIVACAWGVIVLRDVVVGDPVQRRRMLRFAGLLVGLCVVYYGGKYLRYGTPLPHSFLFKELSLEHRPNADAVISDWRTFALPIVVMAACALTLLKRDVFSLALVLFVGVSAVSVLRGPTSQVARYSSHMLPVLVLMSAPALDLLLRRLPVGALVVALWVGTSTLDSYDKLYDLAHWYAGHQACRRRMGQYLEANADRSRPVLSSDIGAVAYVAIDVPFIDTYGLTSADVMRSFASGHSPDEILFRKRPAMVADTHGSPRYKALGFLGGSQMIHPSTPSAWLPRTGVGPDLFQCTSPDGISFGVAALETH